MIKNPGASGGGTIAPNSVTNAQLAQMPANTFKSNLTNSTANAADNTIAAVQLALGIAPNGALSNVTRIPGVLDNTTRGFTTSSIWQYGGTVYSAATYCAADSAAWSPITVSPIATPADVMTTALTPFAGGTCSMLHGYVGAAVDVAVTIGGVYQIFTVNILATGELDNVYLGSLIAQADASTNVKVLKLYDQTGNGNHAALATATGTACAINGTVTATTVLTVNSVTSGTVAVGQFVYGNGITVGTTIASGTGPYVLSTGSATNPGPEAMYLGITSVPYIDWDPSLGRYVLFAPNEQTNGATTNKRALQIPQTCTFTTTRNIGFYAVGAGVNGADQQLPSLCALGDTSVGAGPVVSLNGALLANVYNWGQICITQSGTNKRVPVTIDAQPMVLIASTTSAPLTTINVNEQVGTTNAAITNQALAGGWIFAYGGAGLAQYSMMKLVGIAMFNAAPTAAQSNAMRYGAYTRFNIYPQVQNQVVFVGDSRFANLLVTSGFGTSPLLARFIGRNWRVLNLATSSSTATAQTGDGLVPTVTGIAATMATIKSPGINYAVIMLGVNDMSTLSKTAAQVLTLLQTLCAQIANVGYLPVLVAEMETTVTTGSNPSAQLPVLNAAIVAAGAAAMNAYAIVNLYGYTPVTTPSNTAYYTGGLHPTLALDQLSMSAIAPSIQ